jgi:hypothetical protein
MEQLKTMWASVPPAGPEELAGARQRLLDGMRHPRRAVIPLRGPGGVRHRRRAVTLPRALAAAAAAAVLGFAPQVIGGSSAYAVTQDPDGTITVTLSDLRDPDGLEAELADAGVRSDVTFLEPGTRCQVSRFEGADATYGGLPVNNAAELRDLIEGARTSDAIEIGGGSTFRIHPEHIRDGETLVLEFRDGQGQTLWTLGAWLARAGSPVEPCTPVAAS